MTILSLFFSILILRFTRSGAALSYYNVFRGTYRRDNCVTNLFFNGERKTVSTMEKGKLAKVLFQLNFVLYFSESRCLGRKATATHPTTPTTAAQMNIPEYPRKLYTTGIFVNMRMTAE